MVYSMTGFGRSKAESGAYNVIVEIKSVNHRFSEFHIRMPRQLMRVEEKIKKTINGHLQRGRVEVFVTLEGNGAVHRKLQIDWELLDDYYQLMKTVQQKFGLEETVTVQDLLNREEFIHIQETETGNEELESLVLKSVEEAVINLKQMREAEGQELETDILTQLSQLQEYVHSLKQDAPAVVLQYKERLSKRMQEFLNGQMDEARILTEVAVFAEKADINEELTRLNSHIQQFIFTLKQVEPIGRKLDFLLQEMNRETNTIGSKANDSTIAKKVVEIKSLLEKMKEQVQNIE